MMTLSAQKILLQSSLLVLLINYSDSRLIEDIKEGCAFLLNGKYPIRDVLSYLKCENNNGTIIPCPPNQLFIDEGDGFCIDGKNISYSNFCNGRENDDWSNPWNCHQYISCTYGVPHVQFCSLLDNIVYNPYQDECVLLKDYPCKQIKGNFCADKNDGIYAAGKDVFDFIECINGTSHNYSCPGDSIYSPKYGHCINGKHVSIFNFCQARDDGDWADPWNCHGFVGCDKETASFEPCELNYTVYNPEIDACVLPSTYACKEIQEDRDLEVFVSQSSESRDSVNCGISNRPCRTLHYALKNCFSNPQPYLICYVKVDGGSLTNPYTYFIDAQNDSVSADKFTLSLEALDHSIKPTIKCNMTSLNENGTCIMKITSLLSLTIISINFEGDNSQNNDLLENVLNLQNSGTTVYQLTLTNCTFTSLNIQIASSWSNVMNCSFIHSRFERDKDSSRTMTVLKSTFESTYITGTEFHIEESSFSNSSINTNAYSISQTSFWGSFKDKLTGEHYPQITISPHPIKYGQGLEITFCHFYQSLNGSIEATYENYAGDINIDSCLFIDNARPEFSGKGIVHIENQQSYVKISSDTFQNNKAPFTSGSNIYIANMHQNVTLSSQTKFLGDSDTKTEFYSIIKIRNTRITTNDNSSIQCPANTDIRYYSYSRNFEYFCLPKNKEMYSTQPSTLSWRNGSIVTENAPQFKCPIEGLWTNHGIRSKGNNWGYIANQTGKIIFQRCPSTYCCENVDECLSYDTCRNERTGFLCGTCLPGFSLSIFNQANCTEDCEDQMIWIWILILSASLVVVLILMFSDRLFFAFAYLGRKLTYQNHYKYQKLDRLPEKNEPLRQGEPEKRRQIEGGRAGEMAKSPESNDKEIKNKMNDVDFYAIDYSLFKEEDEISQDDNAQDINNRSTNHIYDENQADTIIVEDHKICQNQRLLYAHPQNNPNEKPVESSTQGILKILFHFYQALGLLLLQNPTTFEKLIPTELLVSFFSFKLQMPSLEWNVCPLQTQNIFHIELIKIGVWLLPTFLITIILLSITIYGRAKKLHADGDERLHQTILQQTDSSVQPPWSVRLKCVYIQLLCLGHTSLTVMLLQFLHSVDIDNKPYHFIDGTKEFSYRNTIVVCSLFVLLFWCLAFIIAFYKGTIWLQNCQITSNQFLTILALPPIILVFWLLIKFNKIRQGLTERERKIAKRIFDTIHQPYRYQATKLDQPNKRSINWECVYLATRFLLAIACVFFTNPSDRLKYISVVLLLHCGLHQIYWSFNTDRLNTIGSICLMSLVLINFLSSIVQFLMEAEIIANVMNILIFISFTPFIAFLILRLTDVLEKIFGVTGRIKARNLNEVISDGN